MISLLISLRNFVVVVAAIAVSVIVDIVVDIVEDFVGFVVGVVAVAGARFGWGVGGPPEVRVGAQEPHRLQTLRPGVHADQADRTVRGGRGAVHHKLHR